METEVLRLEKMLLAATLSHEILNPIAYAKNAAQGIPRFLAAIQEGHISEQDGNQQLEASLRNVQDGIERVCNIADALKSLVKQENHGFNGYDIHKGLETSLKILHTNDPSRIQIHRRYELREKIECKANQINQVFFNLLNNAVHSMESQKHGEIWITTRRQAEDAVIAIRDSGPGITKEMQAKIFKALFTTKEEGMGLGLYICRQIVRSHRGQLSVESMPGQGTQFTVILPLQQPTQEDEKNLLPIQELKVVR